jgi:endoglucanase
MSLLLALFLSAAPWDSPVVGANLFNHVETPERLRAASAAGFRVVRIAPDKWRGAGRDFLLGTADDYRGLVAEDVKRLRIVLNHAHAAGLKVVLTMLSLPGCRWKQHNGNRNDFRLYLDSKFQVQARKFWRDLAESLRGHPAVVGYNLLNEPRPERDERAAAFDLNGFYRSLVEGIREVDPTTPIILDGSDDASPDGLSRLTVLDDPNVLYAFHFYEPWSYINRLTKNRFTKNRFTYPGDVEGSPWNLEQMRSAMAPVKDWQKRNGVPSTRVWLEEFGVPRTKPGAAAWLRDVLFVAQEERWHWAVYSFREDTWDAMDYELGESPPSAAYWQAQQRGKNPMLQRKPNALWKTILDAMALSR